MESNASREAKIKQYASKWWEAEHLNKTEKDEELAGNDKMFANPPTFCLNSRETVTIYCCEGKYYIDRSPMQECASKYLYLQSWSKLSVKHYPVDDQLKICLMQGATILEHYYLPFPAYLKLFYLRCTVLAAYLDGKVFSFKFINIILAKEIVWKGPFKVGGMIVCASEFLKTCVFATDAGKIYCLDENGLSLLSEEEKVENVNINITGITVILRERVLIYSLSRKFIRSFTITKGFKSSFFYNNRLVFVHKFHLSVYSEGMRLIKCTYNPVNDYIFKEFDCKNYLILSSNQGETLLIWDKITMQIVKVFKLQSKLAFSSNYSII